MAMLFVPELLLLLQSDDDDDEDLASDALREIDIAPPDAVPVLIQMLENAGDNRRIRFFALHLLKKSGPAAKSALPVLEKLAEELDGRSREYVRRTIKEIREIPDPPNA